MNIELKQITIKELAKDYIDNSEEGITGYGGYLDIRPPYQREFIYNDTQRKLVIDTVLKGYPLNVMYWAVREDGGYEIIDGQQRTISICQYINRDFSYNGRYFHNLQSNEMAKIFNYELMIYLCTGTPSDKLEWFKTINIAGEKLYPQELLNAVYHGSWVSDAKRYFSKNGCVAYQIGHKYLKKVAIRQEYLETAIKWISNDNIKEYMAEHQHRDDAGELYLYFKKIIDWVEFLFPVYRREMKGIEWGVLYNKYHTNTNLNPAKFEKEIKILMMNDEIESRSGIYYYVFDRKVRYLNLRSFSNNQKRAKYEEQSCICPICKEKYEFEEMDGDHITPWSDGGRTIADNLQMLCRECNRRKSNH